MECPLTDADDGSYIGGLPMHGVALLSLAGILLATIVLLELVLLPSRRKTVSSSKTLAQELLTHVVITGGSSGIGLSIAKECVERGARVVTLLARNPTKLERARQELEAHAKTSGKASTHVRVVAVDVSDQPGIVKAAEDICTSDEHPVPTALLNIAGTSSSAAFVDTHYTEFQRLVEINYLGSAYATRAFLPYILKDSEGIHPRAVAFTSSQAGQLGIYGYTAYSASKFALRGMAEALHMELSPRNVSVQMIFPPDTDTPGFESENLNKPEVTRVISETSGLFSSETMARATVDAVVRKRPAFGVYVGLDGFMLNTLTGGMSPAVNLSDTLYQVFLGGLFRFVSLFYLWDFRNTVRRVEKAEEEKETTKNSGPAKGVDR
mmetsp:Transcript_11380/g.32779  ORF Transcript_11380/g.32779 Transcript_11380/m.32779 type:complete len:380 (-) Transcript_11380:346-1485(-)